MRALVLVLLLAACATTKTAPVPLNPQPPALRFKVVGSKPDEGKLLQLVKDVVGVKFGKPVDDVKMTLWWIPYPGVYEGKRFGGLCFSCGEMYVVDYGSWSLCESSYVHEVIHCLHNVVEGERDHDHSNKKWWDLVEPINKICRAKGWK